MAPVGLADGGLAFRVARFARSTDPRGCTLYLGTSNAGVWSIDLSGTRVVGPWATAP